jgi:hypothetical protein
VTSLPSPASRRTTWELISAVFDHVAEPFHDLPQHPAAPLWPRAGVTLGGLQALQGVGHRAFQRGLPRASRPVLPCRPERPRRVRLCTTHQAWPPVCLASPPGLGGIDTEGLERMHPIRACHRPPPLGRQGVAHHRWMVGGTRGRLVHQSGRVVGWDWAAAHVADTTLQWRMRQVDGGMMGLRDTGFPAAAGDPANRKLGQRGAWQDRLLGETGLAMRPVRGSCTTGRHRGWEDVPARLACTLAALNGLVQW